MAIFVNPTKFHTLYGMLHGIFRVGDYFCNVLFVLLSTWNFKALKFSCVTVSTKVLMSWWMGWRIHRNGRLWRTVTLWRGVIFCHTPVSYIINITVNFLLEHLLIFNKTCKSNEVIHRLVAFSPIYPCKVGNRGPNFVELLKSADGLLRNQTFWIEMILWLLVEFSLQTGQNHVFPRVTRLSCHVPHAAPPASSPIYCVSVHCTAILMHSSCSELNFLQDL